ncbi:thioredoxin domain-containing protein [Candidatus Methylomirabilis sp.]|uniref:DsbA family protein n=1 Tax=Candidatus Methylomirabilis sp. TaxID=2032687 RepID=UPI0030767359
MRRRIVKALLGLFWLMTAVGTPAIGAENRIEGTPPLRLIEVQDSPALGPENAPVTVVEFSDLQCPYCAQISSTLKSLVQLYPGRVRWVFKHFPLRIHPDASLAHEAALAAHEQGKFWEMHDLLLSNQGRLKRDDLISYARRLGLDLQAFANDLDSGRLQARVLRDTLQGRSLRVNTTPTCFINGKRVVGAQLLSRFRQVIDRELVDSTVIPRATPPMP